VTQALSIAVVTLFPEMIETFKSYGVLGRAINQQLLKISCWNPRDFTSDKHRTVDDRPYGGGPGMLMKIEPLEKSINVARDSLFVEKKIGDESSLLPKVIYLSPQGRRLTQKIVQELQTQKAFVLVAGRYEGIDERLISTNIDEELSIGDYVLSGGELAAMVLIDAVARLVPGVLGHEQSALQDSFSEGLLDCPHYTRPEEYRNLKVPGVLLSGDHERIRRWRLKQSLGRTKERRPDLLNELNLNTEQSILLEEYLREFESGESSQD
jgi:tRNA (guanine37-N1)-methyltransferase